MKISSADRSSWKRVIACPPHWSKSLERCQRCRLKVDAQAAYRQAKNITSCLYEKCRVRARKDRAIPETLPYCQGISEVFTSSRPTPFEKRYSEAWNAYVTASAAGS